MRGWTPVRREYVDTFIPDGGGAVRVVVGEDVALLAAERALAAAGEAVGLTIVRIDTASVKLHMLHQAFFAIATSLDWDAFMPARLEMLVTAAGCRWPAPGMGASLSVVADANGIAPTLLRTTLQRQITRAVWDDGRLAHDFRKAMIALLDARQGDDEEQLTSGVLA